MENERDKKIGEVIRLYEEGFSVDEAMEIVRQISLEEKKMEVV